MALTVSFSVSQTKGSPSIVTVTDTSTGTDAAVTQRRVYLLLADGTYLVPTGTTTDYVQWALADTSISIDALGKDFAVQVIVQWLNVSDAVLYTSTGLKGFTLYNKQFSFQLTQNISGNPLLMNDWFSRKSNLTTLIDSGDEAVLLGDDIFNAQRCYDQATEIRLNSRYIFNRNS